MTRYYTTYKLTNIRYLQSHRRSKQATIKIMFILIGGGSNIQFLLSNANLTVIALRDQMLLTIVIVVDYFCFV